MRRVIGIGETVLDIIFKNDQPIGAVPGGSTFNCVISLGRSGINTAFISETGNDRVGRRIISFLQENGVDASCVNVYPDSKSPISLAFLNDQNDAEYIFYKDHPNDRLDYNYPEVQKDDIVVFGSYFAINPVIRPQVLGFLEHAHQQGAILYYDVNYRASHKSEVLRLTSNILENLELADIVRGSSEDFEVMFNKKEADAIYRSQIAFYTHNFILTQGAEPVELRGEGGITKQYPVIRQDQVVSTIGAGDNFNAGFIYGLIRYGIKSDNIKQGLTTNQWDNVMSCALEFSANACSSINNSIDPAFGEEMRKKLIY